MTKLLIVDTETGGTDPERHSLLSIAAVVWEDGRTTAEIEVLVAEPDLTVTAQALEINRIDLVSHFHRAHKPPEALSAFVAFVRNQFESELAMGQKISLAGHNVAFDVNFLKRLFRMRPADFEALFSHRVLDTASVLRFLSLAHLLPEAATASTEAFKVLGVTIPEAQRHTALGDARATAELLTRLLKLTAQRDPRGNLHLGS